MQRSIPLGNVILYLSINPISIEVKVEGEGGSACTYVSWFTLGIYKSAPHNIQKPVKDTAALLLKLKFGG